MEGKLPGVGRERGRNDRKKGVLAQHGGTARCSGLPSLGHRKVAASEGCRPTVGMRNFLGAGAPCLRGPAIEGIDGSEHKSWVSLRDPPT